MYARQQWLSVEDCITLEVFTFSEVSASIGRIPLLAPQVYVLILRYLNNSGERREWTNRKEMRQ